MQSYFGVYSAEILTTCRFYWCNHGPGTVTFSSQISFSCFATLLANSEQIIADSWCIRRVS